ncbi:PAS domain S-box protein [Hwanghaeella sp.]|uniref:PAS domain S-box protein n=1 Tax=Hwanghaeella sp. TaxID=2605943 RepID=UPI003CCBFE91
MELSNEAYLTQAVFRFLAFGAAAGVLLWNRGAPSFRQGGYHLVLFGLLTIFLASLLDSIDRTAYGHAIVESLGIGTFIRPMIFYFGYAAATLVLCIGIIAWAFQIRENDKTAQRLYVAEEGNRLLVERFNTVSDLSRVWLWETNAKGRLTYISDAIEKVGGYPADQYVDRPHEELHWLAIDQHDRSWALEKFAAREAYKDLRYDLRRPDGELRHLSVDGFPLLSEDGEFLGYRGVGRDVTAETATRRALNTISEGLGGSTGEDYLLQLAERLSKSSQFDFVFIGRLHEDGDRIEVVSGVGDGRKLHGFDYNIAASPCGDVIGKSTVCVPKGVAASYPNDELLKDWGIEGYLGVPLARRDGTPIGVVACLSRRPIADVDSTRRIAESFADRAALELERRQMEIDLLDERDRLREALNIGRMGYYYSYVGVDRVHWSDSLFEIAGIEPRELTTSTIKNLIHPDDVDGFYSARQRAIDEGRPYRTEVRVIHPNGDVVWWALTGTPQCDGDGNVVNIFGIVQEVTARKRTELALQEAQQSVHDAFQELRSAIHALPFSVVIYDKDLRKIVHNDAYRELLGYTTEEMWKLETLEDILRYEVEVKKTFGDQTVEDVYADVVSKLDKDQPYFGREYWPTRKVHIERRIAPLPSGGWIFALVDITDLQDARRELEKLNADLERMVAERTRQLQSSEERYRDIAETSADRFWELDADLRVRSISDSFEAFDGADPAEIIGTSVGDFMARTQVGKEDYARVMESFKSHKPFRNMPLTRTVNGNVQHLVVSGNPLFEKGEFAGYRGTSSDVTRLRLAQEELMESEKLASLGRLVAGVAHDVNTPVGNALTVSSSLEETVQELQQAVAEGKLSRQRFDHFLENVGSASKLIRTNLERGAKLIRNFKQVAVDQTSENRRDFEVSELIDEVVTTLQPLFKGNKHIVSLHVPDKILMNSFPGPLGQVITNLVENAAVHAFPEGAEGNIGVFAERCSGERVRIQVRDDGRGASPDLQKNMFEPFFTTRLNSGGSGLGLTIVHNIVTGILGGTIDVESAEGEGTAIIMELPLKAPAHATTAEQ